MGIFLWITFWIITVCTQAEVYVPLRLATSERGDPNITDIKCSEEFYISSEKFRNIEIFNPELGNSSHITHPCYCIMYYKENHSSLKFFQMILKNYVIQGGYGSYQVWHYISSDDWTDYPRFSVVPESGRKPNFHTLIDKEDLFTSERVRLVMYAWHDTVILGCSPDNFPEVIKFPASTLPHFSTTTKPADATPLYTTSSTSSSTSAQPFSKSSSTSTTTTPYSTSTTSSASSRSTNPTVSTTSTTSAGDGISSPNTPTDQDENEDDDGGSTSLVLIVSLAVVCGTLFLVACIFIFLYVRHRRNKTNAETTKPSTSIGKNNGYVVPMHSTKLGSDSFDEVYDTINEDDIKVKTGLESPIGMKSAQDYDGYEVPQGSNVSTFTNTKTPHQKPEYLQVLDVEPGQQYTSLNHGKGPSASDDASLYTQLNK